MSQINKDQLHRFSNLARIEISFSEEEKFLTDFEKILANFAELQSIPEKNNSAQSLPKAKKTALRQDTDVLPDHFSEQEKIIASFPEHDNNFLKIPPIFKSAE
jgi:aspartyl/glutamyl-tRNA(Asn/Gln) amidotransferase C subunit